jgi:hypothetical protein
VTYVTRPTWLDQEAAEPWDEQSEHLAQYALQLERNVKLSQRCLAATSRFLLWLQATHPAVMDSVPPAILKEILETSNEAGDFVDASRGGAQ